MYNKEYVGDVFMVIVKDSKGAKLGYERKSNVSRVFLEKNGETAVQNIFEVSNLVMVEGVGQVTLSDQDVTTLNAESAKEGFAEQSENDPSPKFVVSQVEEMVAHPSNGHLNIYQVQISDDKAAQAVTDASNAAAGLKTIIASPGAIMPNGSLVFPDALRGEKSSGTVCSLRELALLNTPQKRGITKFDDTAIVDEAFNLEKHRKG